MYFNYLVIQNFSVFYTKALKLTVYLVASVNEISDDLAVASSWLRVPSLYSRPVQIALTAVDRVKLNKQVYMTLSQHQNPNRSKHGTCELASKLEQV